MLYAPMKASDTMPLSELVFMILPRLSIRSGAKAFVTR